MRRKKDISSNSISCAMISLDDIKLTIKNRYTVIPVANHKIHLHGGDKVIFLDTDKTLSNIVRRMDGKTSVSQLIDIFKDRISRDELLGFLLALRKSDLVEDSACVRQEACSINTDFQGFISSHFPPLENFKSNESYPKAILQSKICLFGDGVNAAAVEKLLYENGFQIVDRGDHTDLSSLDDHISYCDLAVVAFDSFRPTMIKNINHILVKHDMPFVHGAIEGDTVRIGPTVINNGTACLSCYVSRLEEHNPYIYEYEKHDLPRTRIQSALRLLGTAISYEIIGLVTNAYPPVFKGRVCSYDIVKSNSSFDAIVAKFDCEDCGKNGANQRFGSIKLISRPKKCYLDGGHRTVEPEETLSNTQHLVGRLGIVSSLQRIDDEDEVRLPVYASYTSVDPRSREDMLQLRLHCGKGVRIGQAKASAIFEAIERYCAQSSAAEPVVIASWQELQSDIYPLESLSPPSYWHCTSCNNRCTPVTEYTPIEWVQGFSIAHSKPMLIPANLVFLPYRVQAEGSCAPFVMADSNGIAAGNNLEEAILHATLEVIERDAVTIFHRTRTRCHRLLIDAVKNSLLKYAIDEIQKNKLGLHLNYLPHGLVHTVSAFIIDRLKPRPFYSNGSGTHLDPELAAMRAITEANHVRIGIHHALKTAPGSVEESRFDLERIARLCQADGDITLSGIPNMSTDNILDDINICLDRLKHSGSDILVYNLTRPAIDVPTVRVVSPWLQPADEYPCYRPSRRLKQFMDGKGSEALKSAYSFDWLW